jgi:3-deoxy-D-manno-octulosonate 8-phosphate phosphatase (KDO 8-P phosphatase)
MTYPQYLAIPQFPWPPESALEALPAERAAAVRAAAEKVQLLVFDFDGVMTDNSVYVSQEGVEFVRASRSEGFGLDKLKTRGIGLLVLSKEVNPVVGARCRKLKLECVQGIDDKLPALEKLVAERGLTLDQVGYMGNDTNDEACLRAAGFPITTGDAHPAVISLGLYVSTRPGGYGAVREVCDLIDALKA